MTIPAGNTSITYHTGNGVAVTFDYDFKISAETDLLVTITDLQGVDTVLVLTTDYTVTGVGDDGGGNITLTSALANGFLIAIQDDVEVSQLVQFGNQGQFYGQSHEDVYDKNLRITKKALTAQERMLKIPDTVQSVSTDLPKPESLNLVRWNEDADALENVAIADVVTTAQFSNFKNDIFTDGVDYTAGTTTELTLDSAPGTIANTQVYFDGVYQEKSEYSLAATVITFDSAIPVGVTSVEVVYGKAADVLAGSTREVQLGDGSTTVFTLSNPYEPGNGTLHVYIDGVRQEVGYGYTETDANTVTFDSAPANNDTVLFIVNAFVSQTTADASNVTYTASGTGAVATNVQARLTDQRTLEDFGALGDGSTDDRAAIQAAWDWSASTGSVIIGNAKVYGVGDSGSDINSRSYGLLLKDGLNFLAIPGCTLKVLDGQDIDLINTDRTATLASVSLMGDLTLDGNEANQGASPSNGFNLWAYDITHLKLGTIRSRNPASWGIRPEQCNKIDYNHIDCDHSAETNSDGIHFVDCNNVTGQSANIKSLGDDGYIIEVTNDSTISDYNLGVINVDTDNGLALPARGFLLLGDESVMTGAHVMKNIKASVVAKNCDGGGIVVSGASYENIQIEAVTRNCGYDLQFYPGNSTYTGYATNCVFKIDGADAQTQGIGTLVTNGTIKHCHLDARIHNPSTAGSAVTMHGEYWTGSIQAIYDGTTGTSAGVNWNADNSEMHITALDAKWGLLVQGGAINNTFYLGTLEGNTTDDLNVASGATGNRFIGGRIDSGGSVTLNAGDEYFEGVAGANYRAKVALNFATNADGTVTVAHGLVGTPTSIQLTPQTQVALHFTVDTTTVPDGTNITIYGQNTSGTAYTTGTYNCYIEASL